jgi:hypothetical protein
MRLATQLEVDVLAVKARRQEESGRALLASDSHPAGFRPGSAPDG